MSYNAVPTVATGDVWSAASHNTYIRDNFAAGVPDIFTAAGDLAYATAANAAAPLAIGAPGQVLLSSSDGLPAWGESINVAARQGGSSSDYTTGGTTNYTPTNVKLQCGSIVATYIDSHRAYITVTFPIEFTAKPLVFVSTVIDKQYVYVEDSLTTTQTCRVGLGAYEVSITDQKIYWLAIGPIA